MARVPGRIKIMSWNAHGVGVFKVPHDQAFDDRVLNFLAAENADIMSLPEYSTPKNNVLKPYGSKIIKDNGYKDFRFKDDNTLGTTIFLGTAVFSKFPFKDYVAYRLSYETYLLQGDVELPGGQMLRMFFLHLSTFGLSDDDKAYIEDVKKNHTSLESDKRVSRTFIWKFNHAYRARALEADKAAKIIAESPYPVVVCGDFNDLPGSYTYNTIRGNRNDAFLEKGKGLGRTYNEISPTLHIDHMFYDPTVLKPVGFQCPFTRLSDHNPLIVNFEIMPKAAN
jgi:endonuclease/exonuclease/phosphatase family metal-dependent hydrolase